eukprot:3042440-Pyramimonas_sp.AAC.1
MGPEKGSAPNRGCPPPPRRGIAACRCRSARGPGHPGSTAPGHPGLAAPGRPGDYWSPSCC